MMNAVRLGIRKAFTACSMFFSGVSKLVYRSPQEKEVDRWFRDDGDRTLRVDYDLNKNSVVFDLGGYEGDWAAEIAARYECPVYVFEPVPDYANRISKRFRKNSRVKIFQFGLGKQDLTQTINIAEEGSSLFSSPNVPRNNQNIPIAIKSAAKFIEAENISRIDLMKINIEGGEYDLLDHLIDTGIVKRIRNLQIQFHNFVPQAEVRRANIQEQLAKTHTLTYQYQFVWENWAHKE